MATCGNCKSTGQTVDHIRACYLTKSASIPTSAAEYVPMALTAKVEVPKVPASKYALDNAGTLTFFDVREGKNKWAGYIFVDRLVGHPGDWARFPVRGESRAQVLAHIAADPKGSAVLFSHNFTVCAVCSSPLSDPESLATGLGPVCAKRF